jgi:serine/threonine protein phosphatase PrpC
MRLSFYGSTSAGRQRDHNEDSHIILCDVDNKWQEINNIKLDLSNSKGVVFAVADGMGGANAGEIASDIAVRTVKERITKITSVPEDNSEIHKLLNAIIIEGHNKIIKASRRNNFMKGMGTTIVVGCIFKETLYVAWSGDSRCYVYNKNCDKELLPFTDDHSLVWERVINKEITPEDARLSEDSNLILQSLGGALLKPEPEFKWIKLKKDDIILFCSDGLNSMLSNIGIQQILDYNSSPEETCTALIQAANNAGGRDNITLIVVDIFDNSVIESDSGSHENNKQVKRKKPYILLLLLFFILVIASVIYFRPEIESVFQNIFTKDSSLFVTQRSDTAVLSELINKNPGVDSVPSAGPVVRDSIKNTDLKVKTTRLASDATSKIDSTDIENKMKEAINKISSIKNKIDMVKPGGAIYNSEFYDKNKAALDSVLAGLTLQEEMIKRIVLLNSNNYLIKVNDYGKAKEIYNKIGKTLAELEIRTNIMIEPQY